MYLLFEDREVMPYRFCQARRMRGSYILQVIHDNEQQAYVSPGDFSLPDGRDVTGGSTDTSQHNTPTKAVNQPGNSKIRPQEVYLSPHLHSCASSVPDTSRRWAQACGATQNGLMRCFVYASHTQPRANAPAERLCSYDAIVVLLDVDSGQPLGKCTAAQ